MPNNSPAPSIESIVPKSKRRQQLHISGVNMMADCGQRFLYRYILNIKRPPNAFLLVGKATDESVTQNLNSKIDTGELMRRDAVLDVATTAFDKAQADEPIELDADEKKEGKSLDAVLGEAKDKTVCLAGLHHDDAAPTIIPAQTRRRFSVDMDAFLRSRAKDLHQSGDDSHDKLASKSLHFQAQSLNAVAKAGVDFVGEQDIVERIGDKLIIRDTKTASKSPVPSIMDGAEKPGAADDSDQLTAYATASHVIDGKLPDVMVLDYLVRTNAAKPTVKYVPSKTSRSMDDVQVFLNRFTNAVHALKTGVFVPANQSWWGCSKKWCGWWDICPYSKKPTLVQITKEIPNA